ncbi:hypothetical protein N7540_007543 [Penicillium herquei]|nr:hypothetical protein N7540_007543 [Penicillium herquei]
MFIGWVFWGNLFYLPLYFQIVRGLSPSAAGSLILPMVIAHGATSGLSGAVMSLTGCYKPVICIGAASWAIGSILKSTYAQATPFRLFIITGILEGIVLVGLLAGTDNVDRAVITGLRNFIRDMGGSIGITGEPGSPFLVIQRMIPNTKAVSGAILNNILQNGLKERFSPEIISRLTSSALSLPELKLSDEDKRLVLAVYARGLNTVFISFSVLTVIMFMASLGLRDYGLGQRVQLSQTEVHNGPGVDIDSPLGNGLNEQVAEDRNDT